jgi:hypothetical protein
MIDWTKPIETDEATPRSCAVIREACGVRLVLVGQREVHWFPDDGLIYWRDGELHIRNVIPAPAPMELELLDDGMRTAAKYALEVVRKYEPGRSGLIHNLGRLEEFLDRYPARFEPPVDPDLIEARKIAHSTHAHVTDDWSFLDGTCDDGDFVQSALAAIKRGRELEREAIGAA